MDVNSTPVESSSAAPIEVPRDPQAYQKWRQTGETPAAPKTTPVTRTPKADPAPAKESSEAPVDGAENDAPASEAGTQQEPKKRSNAETRLKDLLDDLKRAGLSPAELKTFKREAQKDEATGTEAKAAPEPTVQPSGPVEPKLEDFESYEKFQEAMVDYRVDKKFHEREERAKAAEQQKEIDKTLEAARSRYGDATDTTIGSTAKAVFSDAKIPSAVKALINDSPVMVDLLFTLGSKEAELQEFLDLAKSNPGQAIRKVVLLERLVSEELAGGQSAAAGDQEAGRDESGKFVSAKAPAKKVTDAPPPPREASGRSAAPPDAVESAAKANDFASFKNAANRRDLAKFQGK